MTALSEVPSVEPLEHQFGLQPGLAVGVEHELLVVDPDTRELCGDAGRVIAACRPTCGWLASEIFAGEIELVSPVCVTVGDALRALDSLLAAVRAAGGAVIGSGLHPTVGFGEAQLSTSPRYSVISDSLQGLLRSPPAALHVHVGMPDPETAIRVANGLRRHLPLLHALAANSPFWFGEDSGLASARTAILRSYPRYGVPRWFRDWEDFSFVARDLTAAAGVPDYTYFWWDVRPHPRLGTVEVRAPDAQFCAARAAGLAALVHALAAMEADRPPPAYESREAIEEACYQATRYGLEAWLPDHRGGRRTAAALARELLREVRPYARDLGCDAELAEVRRILREGNGADVQRRVHAEGGIYGLLKWLTERQV